MKIVYLSGSYPKPEYLSLLQVSPDDLGRAGAQLALSEIQIAGRFVGRDYVMEAVRLPNGADLASTARRALSESKIVVADLDARDLLTVADLPEARDALILDVRTHDDNLRQKECRANTFHLLPSTAALADALAQYLVAKRWPRWFVLKGTTTADAAYVVDLRRAARRFGATIVEERDYAYDTGARRVDTGYQQIQSQMPLATRNAPDHDVLVVADTSDVFGDYLLDATDKSRFVVGTQGLVPLAWSPAFQEYSALQMQHRFQTQLHRPMLEADYAGWLAVRAIGEAVIRSGRTSAVDLSAFMRSPQFEVAGFKGQPLTFRPWDLQLRQPVLLANALMVVSMSPQEGFLHPRYLTDTLGFDAPETQCHFAF